MPIDPAEVPAPVRGRRVAVLVSGGIAAYKVADLVSQLVQAGCQVRVAMTQAALGDMAAGVDASALLTYRAAWRRDVQKASTTREAAMRADECVPW